MYREAENVPIVAVAAKLGMKFHRMGNAILVPCPLECHEGPPLSCFLLNYRAYCWRCAWSLKSYEFAACVLRVPEFEAVKWILRELLGQEAPERQSSFPLRPDYDANAPPWPGEKRFEPSGPASQ